MVIKVVMPAMTSVLMFVPLLERRKILSSICSQLPFGVVRPPCTETGGQHLYFSIQSKTNEEDCKGEKLAYLVDFVYAC